MFSTSPDLIQLEKVFANSEASGRLLEPDPTCKRILTSKSTARVVTQHDTPERPTL